MPPSSIAGIERGDFVDKGCADFSSLQVNRKTQKNDAPGNSSGKELG